MGAIKNILADIAAKWAVPIVIQRGSSAWTFDSASDDTPVDDQFAIKIGTVWACVKLLSNSVGTLPTHVKERTETGRVILYDHPVAALMRKPNPKMNGVQFRRAMMLSWALRGNAYALISERNEQYQPTRLDFIPPQNVSIFEGDDDVFYKITGYNQTFASRDIIHLKDLSTDGIVGKSPIRQHADLLDMSRSSLAFGKSFYKNGCRTTGVFKSKKTFSPEAYNRLTKELTQRYFGVEKFGKPLVLEDDLDYTPITIPPEDAQFVATRLQSVDEIAAIFGVPPHMVGDLSHATFSNIEHQGIEFYTLDVRPILVSWEAEFNDKLFAESEKGRVYIDIDFKGLLRADTAVRGEFFKTMYNTSSMTPNQIRECEDLNGYEGGDTYYRPLNMSPVLFDKPTPIDVVDDELHSQPNNLGAGMISELGVGGLQGLMNLIVEPNLSVGQKHGVLKVVFGMQEDDIKNIMADAKNIVQKNE
ncbi:MAG: phage portal protein [Alistipes sp.]